jgi:hypothetical protein
MLNQDDMFHNNDIIIADVIAADVIAADVAEIEADESFSVNVVLLFLSLLSLCILYMM